MNTTFLKLVHHRVDVPEDFSVTGLMQIHETESPLVVYLGATTDPWIDAALAAMAFLSAEVSLSNQKRLVDP